MNGARVLLLTVVICLIVGILVLKQARLHREEAAAVATAGQHPTMLELGSTTCVPCKQMAPIIDALKVELAGKVEVVFIDIYAKGNEKVAEQYSVQTIPTQIFLDREGNELARNVGVISREDILAKMRSLKML
jgi:thioredoxin 1